MKGGIVGPVWGRSGKGPANQTVRASQTLDDRNTLGREACYSLAPGRRSTFNQSRRPARVGNCSCQCKRGMCSIKQTNDSGDIDLKAGIWLRFYHAV